MARSRNPSMLSTLREIPSLPGRAQSSSDVPIGITSSVVAGRDNKSALSVAPVETSPLNYEAPSEYMGYSYTMSARPRMTSAKDTITSKAIAYPNRKENATEAQASQSSALPRLSLAGSIGNIITAVPNRRSSLLMGPLTVQSAAQGNIPEPRAKNSSSPPVLKPIPRATPLKMTPASSRPAVSFKAIHMPFDGEMSKPDRNSNMFHTPDSIKSTGDSEAPIAIHSGKVNRDVEIRESSTYVNLSRKKSSFDIMVNIIFWGSTDPFPVHRRLLSDNSKYLCDLMQRKAVKNGDNLHLFFVEFRHFEYFFHWLYTNNLHLGKECTHATLLPWDLFFELYEMGRELKSHNFQNHVIDMLHLKIDWYGAPPLTTANLSYTESTANTGLRSLIADSLFDTKIPEPGGDDKEYSPVQGTHSIALLLDLLRAEQEQRKAAKEGKLPQQASKKARRLRENVCVYHDHGTEKTAESDTRSCGDVIFE